MIGFATNNGGGPPYPFVISLKDVDPAFVQANGQWLFCLDPITASLPAGVAIGDIVYFDVVGGNAVNVRAAIKTTTRNPQGFSVDTWS
jgi:hypothetical protein